MILFERYGMYDYTEPGNLKFYYEFLQDNLNLEGDVCEIGVFNGKSLLSTAYLLKLAGSNKTVYGFDSFYGFPSFHQNDEQESFKRLLESNQITQDHFDLAMERSKQPRHNFETANKSALLEKIEDLDLDNIVIVEGSFEDTMKDEDDRKFMAVLMDCDLYLSDKIGLSYSWSRLVPGGYMYLDEYYSLKYPGARLAVEEFFADKIESLHKHQTPTGEFERWSVTK